MTQNNLTIVIPTRNRSKTLYDTIRTCLNQNYSNLQIIISDNNSVDNTRGVVESFDDIRIKYFNTGKSLSMSENFDFGLSKVNNGYVMAIGDDDGVLPNSMDYVNELINNTKCEAIVSHNAFYSWPETPNPNKLNFSERSNYEIRDSSKWFLRYLNFNMLYTFDLPGVYCGFVKVDVLKRLTKNEKYFNSSTPDAYSALANCFIIRNYVYSYKSFVIHGSGPKSNGAAYLSKGKNQEGDESKLFFKENTIPFHHKIEITKSFRVWSIEALLQFLDHFPEYKSRVKINWKHFLIMVMSEANSNTKDEIEYAVKKMCLMHNINFDEIKTKTPHRFSQFKDLTLGEFLVKIKYYFLRKAKKSRNIIEDTTKYGVYNVYDASILLASRQDLT